MPGEEVEHKAFRTFWTAACFPPLTPLQQGEMSGEGMAAQLTLPKCSASLGPLSCSSLPPSYPHPANTHQR